LHLELTTLGRLADFRLVPALSLLLGSFLFSAASRISNGFVNPFPDSNRAETRTNNERFHLRPPQPAVDTQGTVGLSMRYVERPVEGLISKS
jgi:hypothetical protein